jgi:hypothetical protein
MSLTKACSRWAKVSREERADSEHPKGGTPLVTTNLAAPREKVFLVGPGLYVSIARCGTAQSCRTTFSSEL